MENILTLIISIATGILIGYSYTINHEDVCDELPYKILEISMSVVWTQIILNTLYLVIFWNLW